MEPPKGQQILDLMRQYQVPCILAAAVDLDLFSAVSVTPRTAAEVAQISDCDLRATIILLDALAAIELLDKQDEHYSLSPQWAGVLQEASTQSVVAILRHHANCLRRWSRLPWTARTGVPQEPGPSVRGADADQAAFIEGMHVVSRDVAAELVRQISPGGVRCVLDVGGASGSWTVAWLEAEPSSRAIIFDLAPVIALARDRLAGHPLADRIELVAGDFYVDHLPTGVDLAWVSAIIHQNSREQNRRLYQRIGRALQPEGWLLIRDVVMQPSRIAPRFGALFAVNMLSATEAGNTYTFAEIEADLLLAGFADIQLVHHDEGMHSIVRARLSI